MISTNGAKDLSQHLDLSNATEALLAGKLVLLPTDTVWSIACRSDDAGAVARAVSLKRQKSVENFELLVDSLPMMRRFVDEVHPRLETLLAYHVRPLTIAFAAGRNLPTEALNPDGGIAVRLVQDDYCRAIITTLGIPLFCTAASLVDGEYPPNFGAISSEVFPQVDYVEKYRQGEKSQDEPSVVVYLDSQEELEFIRE